MTGTTGTSGLIGGFFDADAEDGTVAYAAGLVAAMPSVDTGTITNSYGLKIAGTTVGAGSIGTQYGIYINNLNEATTNWDIFHNSTAANIGMANGATLSFKDASLNTFFSLVDSGSTTTADINGTLEVNLPASTNNFAVCHETNGASNDQILKDCTSTPSADYMENYPVASDVEKGDIVIPGTKSIVTKDGDRISQLVKSTAAYQLSVIGIVSDKSKAGDFNSIGYNINESDNPQPVALNGRVPVKVSPASDDINPGDLITTSNDPGKAMKANGAGFIVGKALESWSAASGKKTVMVYVNNAYYNPIATDKGASTASSTTTIPTDWIDTSLGLEVSKDVHIDGSISAKKAVFTELSAQVFKLSSGKLTVDANGKLVTQSTIEAKGIIVAALEANEANIKTFTFENLIVANITIT